MKGLNAQNISDYLSKATVATASTMLIAGLPFTALSRFHSVSKDITRSQSDLSLEQTRDDTVLLTSWIWTFADSSSGKNYSNMAANELKVKQSDRHEFRFMLSNLSDIKSAVVWCRMANAVMGFTFFDDSATTVNSENREIVAKFFFVNWSNFDQYDRNLNHIA